MRNDATINYKGVDWFVEYETEMHNSDDAGDYIHVDILTACLDQEECADLLEFLNDKTITAFVEYARERATA